MRTSSVREVVGGVWPIREPVGNPQCSGDVDGLGDIVPRDHLKQGHKWWWVSRRCERLLFVPQEWASCSPFLATR